MKKQRIGERKTKQNKKITLLNVSLQLLINQYFKDMMVKVWIKIKQKHDVFASSRPRAQLHFHFHSIHTQLLINTSA